MAEKKKTETKKPETKICPMCAETIAIADAACRYCGTKFDIVNKGYCMNCHKEVGADSQGICPVCGNTVQDPHIVFTMVENLAPPATRAPIATPAPFMGTPAQAAKAESSRLMKELQARPIKPNMILYIIACLDLVAFGYCLWFFISNISRIPASGPERLIAMWEIIMVGICLVALPVASVLLFLRKRAAYPIHSLLGVFSLITFSFLITGIFQIHDFIPGRELVAILVGFGLRYLYPVVAMSLLTPVFVFMKIVKCSVCNKNKWEPLSICPHCGARYQVVRRGNCRHCNTQVDVDDKGNCVTCGNLVMHEYFITTLVGGAPEVVINARRAVEPPSGWRPEYESPDFNDGKFYLRKSYILAGILLLLSWFVLSWDPTIKMNGLQTFQEFIKTMNFTKAEIMATISIQVGMSINALVILTYGLWLIPLAGLVSLVALSNRRVAIGFVYLFAGLAWFDIIFWIFLLFQVTKQAGAFLSFADFGIGVFVAFFSALWLMIGSSMDKQRLVKKGYIK